MIRNYVAEISQDKDLGGDSENWANWMSALTLTTCKFCAEQHGKIVQIQILHHNRRVQAHLNCLCVYVPMRTKAVGTVTMMGNEGADVYLFYYGKLPNYYVSKEAAEAAGWKKHGKNVSDVMPGKMIGGSEFKNNTGKLPSAPGRIWYEADINYTNGKRNRQRILYSNDGLFFVTYDHYHTFYNITP